RHPVGKGGGQLAERGGQVGGVRGVAVLLQHPLGQEQGDEFPLRQAGARGGGRPRGAGGAGAGAGRGPGGGAGGGGGRRARGGRGGGGPAPGGGRRVGGSRRRE